MLAAIAAEVAVACVYVGVHYAIDVLAGLAIGVAGSGAAWLALGAPGIAWLLAAAEIPDGRAPEELGHRGHLGRGWSVGRCARS